ncbi:MAG: hypothetical protein NTX17_02505 [Candidatus Eisenbacteria bacterium]|nr:hypothetical protein [Candidatus Eisenbacteria bacterium]
MRDRTSKDGTSLTDRVVPGRKLGDLSLFSLLIAVAALPFLAGCIAYLHTSLPIVIETGGHHGYYGDRGYSARPHPQYYCYDCHGYTYFDPYYDYCVQYGFRFRWSDYPSAGRYYRQHYPVIVQKTPHFGEYKYKPDYRTSSKYERPPDYEALKKSEGRTFYEGRKTAGEKSIGGKSSASKATQGKKSSGKSSVGK